MNNLDDQKQKILQFIRMRGPNITMRVSNYLKVDSLITSAFLSDLLSDKAIKMSSMKVGNSPIYLIPGQELQLEAFSHYLGAKEKEAFEILKREKVLDDNKLLPAIRVALRAIKDFAFSLEYNGNLYWRYISVNENEAYELINKGMTNFSQLPQSYRPVQNIPQIVPQKIQEVQIEKPIIENEIQPKIVQKAIEPIFQNEPLEKVPKTIEVTELKPKIRRTKTIKKNLFIEKVEDYLKREGIEISNVIKKGK